MSKPVFPSANGIDTHYITSEAVTFSPLSSETPTHTLTLRHIQHGEYFHIALLYHYYRIFYGVATELSSDDIHHISTFINSILESKRADMPTIEEIKCNNMIPSDILEHTAVQTFLSSTSYLYERSYHSQNIIFALYLKPIAPSSSSSLSSDSINNDNITTQWGTPIAFVQLYALFSSVSLSTNYHINDLYVDASYRSLKCGTRLLQQCISYTRDILKPLSLHCKHITLSIRTQFTNIPGQRLYPYMGFKEVEKNERLQRYLYEMVL